MSIIVSRRTLAEAADFMMGLGVPVSINMLAAHFEVGYSRAAEITRYGTRNGWYTQTNRHGRTMYYPTGARPETPGDTPAEVAEVPVTFGVEAEMDFLIKNVHDADPEDVDYTATGVMHSDPTARAGGWEARSDMTVGAEVASPRFSDVNLAARSMRRQWEHWMVMNEEDDYVAAPYFIGANPEGHRTIGTHIHIGTAGRYLTRAEKHKIANLAIMEYPLVIAICANSPNENYVSTRIGIINARDSAGAFARPMDLYEATITTPAHGCGDRQHYFEISDSYHGTVEFRAQDSTIPQAILTAAWILQSLAKKALAEPIESRTRRDVNLIKYRNRRDHAVSEGPFPEELRDYADELIEKLGDVTLDDLPTSVKEILFLALKKGVLPAHIYSKIVDDLGKKFEYFSRTSVKPEIYLEALLQMPFVQEDERVMGILANWAGEARNCHRLSDLKNTPADIDGPSVLDPPATASVAGVRGRFQDQDWFEGEPENGWFRIRDLTEEQRNQLSLLLNHDRDDGWIPMSVEEARRNVDRFWIEVNRGNVEDFVVEVRERARTIMGNRA